MTIEAQGRILTRDTCARLIERVNAFAHGGGTTSVTIKSWWSGELRWARNHVTMTADRRNVELVIQRVVNQTAGTAHTNQCDDLSLECAVRAAERMGQSRPGNAVSDFVPPSPVLPIPQPVTWSDATYNATAEIRGGLAHALAHKAAEHELLSAGFLRMYGCAQATGSDVSGVMRYQSYTIGECSLTVRNPQGTGSGWAGQSGYDWAAIDGATLADRAVDACLASVNPVAIEPGRYTVLFEPQAVYDLTCVVVNAADRATAELGLGPFAAGVDPLLGMYRTKLGSAVVDPRITIRHDPMDPQLGILAQPGLTPITWIDHGVLTTLTNDRESHALPLLNENLASLARRSFRMSGGTSSIEEMIATTERGVHVTRLSGVQLLDDTTLLCTGVTRDGLWLIEHGKRVKAVKNMRFAESPLFALNNIDQLGIPVSIFSAYRPELASAIVPPLKVRDFHFTSYLDAV